MRLAVSEIFPSYNALQTAWFSHNQVLEKNYRILENKSGKCFRANCISAPERNWKQNETICQCHINARPVKNSDGCLTGEWKICSFHGVHTCSDYESTRKRNYKCSVLNAVSPSLSGYVPNRKKRIGAAQQVREIAQRSNGIHLTKSHAYKVVTAKRRDGIEVHIGQYFLLTSYFQHLKRADPEGSFILETQHSLWQSEFRQFQRCYVAFSFAKYAWSVGSIRVVTSDGTFTTSPVFNHIILLAVTHDGNNQLVLLAYAICDIENESNWTWFGEQIGKDFEGATAFVADFDKGIQSHAFQSLVRSMGAKFGRCVRHMIANARDHGVKRKIPDSVSTAVYALAKCRTKGAYQTSLQYLEHLDKDIADWFHERKEQFAAYLFLLEGKPRFGKQLNNAAEQMNSVIEELRQQPILDLLVGLSQWMIKKFVKHSNLSKQWAQEGLTLTAFAQTKHLSCMQEASRRSVLITYHEGTLWRAQVAHLHNNTPGSRLDVEVNAGTFQIQCPCQYQNEYGRPCIHAMAIIIHAKLEPNDNRWYNSLYHLVTYSQMYSWPIPSISLLGNLMLEELLPPEHTVRGGRPKKKRYESSSARPMTCRACGIVGHTQLTCQKPSTQIRYLNHRQQALQYAESEAKMSVM
jgi:hypothetical protein